MIVVNCTITQRLAPYTVTARPAHARLFGAVVANTIHYWRG